MVKRNQPSITNNKDDSKENKEKKIGPASMHVYASKNEHCLARFNREISVIREMIL
jgi:hypothetical protein